jgi:hypothetical protein
MTRLSVLLVCIVILLSNCSEKPGNFIDLSGTWQFQIDSLDQGVEAQWFKNELTDQVELPGSMATNGKGNVVTVNTQWTGGIVDSSWYYDDKYAKYREPGNVKIPFWLQPDKYYVGAAWYQRTVEIPAAWKEKHIELYLERCHWETRLWIDDHELGMQNSLATPHIYDLSAVLTPGKHIISILVDNRIKEIDPGINSHSIADHTQSNWNGIVGKIELTAKPKIYLGDIRVDADVSEKTILISGKVRSENAESRKATISIDTKPEPESDFEIKTEISVKDKETPFAIRFLMGENSPLWDEFDPNLIEINVQLESELGTDSRVLNYGIRDFGVQGTRFAVNERPIFLRGTLECAIFPKTGFPPTDPEEWSRIYKVIQNHGLNHVRFHSWCPPEAAFKAADELGIFLQVECSSWANQSTQLGDGLPIDDFIYAESERIVATYGNHPSFVMMAYGNEPRGRYHQNYLANFLDYWKQKDDRRIYTSAAGWPALQENEFHNVPQPRIQAWGAGLNSLINRQKPSTNYDWTNQIEEFEIPVVSHEIGQWCVYPNFEEIPKYNGILKAKNFEIFQETLAENGLSHLADSFLLASGKLQALCYKADIEAALRTPGFGGFQLLDLHDFPGQGTALVGVLDPFWEEKGYVSPEEYSRFCNTTVPLARMDKRVFYNDEIFDPSLEVAHFGTGELKNPIVHWNIQDQDGKILFEGKVEVSLIKIDNGQNIATIHQNLGSITKASQLTLTVNINQFENSWDFWVYPRDQQNAGSVLLTKTLDEKAVSLLKNGGNVLWSIPEETVGPKLNDGIGFSSIFWNTAWTKGQKPNSLGILCDPDHPALAAFPTEYHSNWQWWDAMSYSNAIILDDFEGEIQPIVRVIDDWFTNRSQALLIEVKVGEGKLLISSIDFFKDIENRPAGSQLLYSLKKYMASNEFSPSVEVSTDDLKKILSQ